VHSNSELKVQCSDSIDRDIIFIVDQSGQFGSQHWDVSRKFLHDVVNTVGTKNNRYAMITFAHDESVDVCFNHFSEENKESDVNEAIDQAAHGTATTKALEKAADVLKDSAEGREKTVIYITDEKSSNSGLEAAAEALRAKGATIYAVGTGDLNGGDAELVSIAGAEDRVFVRDMNHLNREFGNELGGKLCHVASRIKRLWSMIMKR